MGRARGSKPAVERAGSKPLVAWFGGIPLKRQKNAVLTDRRHTGPVYPNRQLVTRLLRGRCELCQRTDNICRAPRPHARRPRPDRAAAAPMGPGHGQDPPQGPRGLRRLPRPDPRAPRLTAHAVVTGEPDTRKRVRPVRGQAERKRTSTTLAPRRSAEPTRTVREQFLVEITGEPRRATRSRHPVADLAELNALFTAWVETVYHRQIHSETGQAPLARWPAGGPSRLPSPDALAEAFLWDEQRTVTKTATGVAAGQHLPGRPAAGRAPGRAGVRPVRPHPTSQVRLRGGPGRHRDPAPDRPPRPPQGPTRDPTRSRRRRPGSTTLRLIDRRPPRPARRPRHRRQLRRPRRQHRPPDSSRPASTHDQLPGQLDLLTDLLTADAPTPTRTASVAS